MATAAWRGLKSKVSAVRGSGGYEANTDIARLGVRRIDERWVFTLEPFLVGSAPTLEAAQEAAERTAQDLAGRYGSEGHIRPVEEVLDERGWAEYRGELIQARPLTDEVLPSVYQWRGEYYGRLPALLQAIDRLTAERPVESS